MAKAVSEKRSGKWTDSSSLSEMVKNRIVEDIIKDAQSKMEKKYSLLIGDDHTISILHHVLKMHELNELNIGVVLNVKYDRERVKVSPIYFLSPTQESVQAMINDYKDPNSPRYGAPIHAYFCSSLSSGLIEMIKASSIRKYMKTLKEIPCDFLVIEKKVFSFNRDSAFDDLYISKESRGDELTKTAKQLVGLLLSMNEEPFIRYSKESRMAGQLAQSVSTNFNQLKRSLTHFEPRSKRSCLIIMDRCDDPITPLMHELTFQAMVMDMLNDKMSNGKIDMSSGNGGNDNNNESKYEESKDGNNENNNGKLRAMPDENDEIWVQYRHGFIGDVVQQLPEQFKKWQSMNAVVKLKNDSNKKVDSRTLIDAARDMPQYKTLIKKYTTNINLASSLIELYKNYGMKELITLEQDIVTGINEDGNKCEKTKIQQEFCNSVLLDPNKPQELKLRMFMMYVISQGGMKPDQRRQLMKQSQFDDKAEQIILNLSSLGVLLQSDKPQLGHKNKDYWKSMQKIAKSKCETESITRYTTYLEWILNSHVNNDLKDSHFDWIDKPSRNEHVFNVNSRNDNNNDGSNNSNNSNRSGFGSLISNKSPKQRIATSYRRHRNTTDSTNNNNSSNGSNNNNSNGVNGNNSNNSPNKPSMDDGHSGNDNPRLIVYILGGVSYSEMCVCYKFSKKYNIDVFIGSTSLLSPAKYLQLLSKPSDNKMDDAI